MSIYLGSLHAFQCAMGPIDQPSDTVGSTWMLWGPTVLDPPLDCIAPQRPKLMPQLCLFLCHTLSLNSPDF